MVVELTRDEIGKLLRQHADIDGISSARQTKHDVSEEVKCVEKRLNKKLPETYRNFLLDFPEGAFFVGKVVPMQATNSSDNTLPLSEIFGVILDGERQDAFFLLQSVDELPEGLIWIATNEFGDRIILDVVSDHGSISFWDRTKPRLSSEVERVLIADSFAKFVKEIRTECD